MRLSEEEFRALQLRRKLAGTARVYGQPFDAPLPAPPKKRPKYGNKPTVVCGEQFDSGKEAQRYEQLLLLERACKITQLRHHVRYPLTVNGIDICEYEVDFVYVDEQGVRHYEDVKADATITPAFRMKQRLMLAIHGITVEVIR